MANWKSRGSWLGKYVLPPTLPVVGAAAGYVASASGTPDRVYWILVALASILAAGILNAFKTRRADSASRDAVSARANLATALTKAGQPLVAAVGDVTGSSGTRRQAKLDTLQSRAVQVAQSQCGRLAETRPDIRASLYLLEDGKLVRRACEGRPKIMPQQEFGANSSANDEKLIKIAQQENTLVEPDTAALNSAGIHLEDATVQSYSGLLAVPVRAAHRGYGLLIVDSDRKGCLTEIDAGYVQLIAGLIAAGIAQGGDET